MRDKMKKIAAQQESEKTMWDSFLRALMTFFNVHSASQVSVCCGKAALMQAGAEPRARVRPAECRDARGGRGEGWTPAW